jgi:hypothetical protein
MSAAVSLAVAAIVYLPWLPVLLGQTAEVGGGYWIPDVDIHALTAAFVNLFWPSDSFAYAWPETLAAVMLVVVLLFPYRNGQLERFFTVLVVVLIVAVVGTQSVLGRSVFMPRYLACLLPFAVAVVPLRIAKLPDGLLRRLAVVVFAADLAIIGYYAAEQLVASASQPDSAEEDAAKAAKFLTAARRHDACIVFNDPCVYLTFCYNAKESADLWFWNPDLKQTNRVAHEPFLSCMLPHRRLDREDVSVSDRSRIWFIDSRLDDSTQYPPDWIPEKGKEADLPYFEFGGALLPFRIADPSKQQTSPKPPQAMLSELP